MDTDIENNLNNAIELIEAEDFKAAGELLKEVLKSDSANFEAYKNLGLCNVNEDNWHDAILNFTHAKDLNPDDATVLYYLACSKSNIGEKEDAAELFNQVLTLRPAWGDATKALAMLYIELGQPDDAISVVLRGLDLELNRSDYSFYYILATSYMLKYDFEGAIKYLKSALKLNPDYLPLMNSLANCYMNTGDYKNALKILKKARKINDKDSLCAYNIAICYQVLEDYKKALKFMQEAYSLEPTITMMASLAFCALKAEKFDLAINLYANLVNVYPNNIQYRLSYISALEASGDLNKALENVNMLLGLNPKNIDLIKKKGTYLRKLGYCEESLDTFKTLVNRGKIDVEVYYNMAYNYVDLEDFDNAKEMFKKCIILEPHNPYAHKDLGVLYLKMNCYDWAVDEMKRAIELEEGVSEFHYSLGVARMMLSDIENAKIAFNRALELVPGDANCLAYQAYILMLEREFEKAKEILKRALSLDPENFLAKCHISKLYFQEKNYSVAREFLKDIIEKTSDDESKNMLAVCYMNTNEFENAMGILSKLAVKYPKNHIILTDLARCELNCGKKKEALEHLRQALMIFDDYEDALKLIKEIEND